MQRVLASRSLVLAGLMMLMIFSVANPAAAAPDRIVGSVETLSPPVHQALEAVLYDYQVFDVDTAAIERQVRKTGQLSLYLGNRALDLDVELNDLRGPGYQAVVMFADGPKAVDPGPVTTYRGTVRGEDGSVVRLTIRNDRFEGYVRTQHEWLFIDPLDRYSDAGSVGDVVVYRDRDVRPEASGLCGSDHLGSFATGFGADAGLDLVWDGSTGILENISGAALVGTLQVATEGDGQHYQRYGNPGTFNQAQSILNGVDGIYQAQLNLGVTITYQQAWPSAGSDPYTSLDAVTTLNQFRSWWQSNRGGTTRDVAHMFSGKDFNGGTVGIAWVGVVCNSASLSYGISEDLQNSFLNRQLTAHEIGHNLSARHDNQSPVCPGVNCNGSGPIMCSFIQSSGSNTFSSCSRSSIASHIANYGFCL